MKKALVVIDYQNDFVNGSLGFEQAEKISENIYSLVEKSLGDNDYIVFTKDTHYENYLETREGKFLPIKHCIKGTSGHDLFGKLKDFEKNENINVIEKETFGSDKLCPDIEKHFNGAPDVIELCGIVTNICVLSNAVLCLTHFKDTKIVVHENATAALGDMQKYAIDILKGLGVEII